MKLDQPDTNYYNKIKQLVLALNKQLSIEQTIKLLNKLKQADIQFINSFNKQCIGHILLTRHGKCQNWSQKKFGFNPNSGLSQQAISAMSITKKITKQLLLFQDTPSQIWISPLIRAKQTAMLALPDKIKTNISYDLCLSELSDYPSGNFITSYGQMKREYDSASLFGNPKKVITYKISSLLFGGQGVFGRIQELSKEADVKLRSLSLTQIEFLNEDSQKLRQKSSTTSTPQQKINQAKKIITNYLSSNQKKDLWLFGHNKNLRTLLKQVINNDSPFQFGQTRRLYYIKSDGNQFWYYCPPYSLLINQQNGMINGKLVEGFAPFVEIERN